MKQCLLKAACAALLLTLISGSAWVESSDPLSSERLGRFKDRYGYGSWGHETGTVISGLSVSENVLPRLDGMRNAWRSGRYSVAAVEKNLCAEIRQAWEGPTGRMEVTQVVAPTFEAAKAYLIQTYADTSMFSPPVRPEGRRFGLEIGRICFVTPVGKGAAGFSSIDFIRHNVLFMLRAEGNVQALLKGIAESLDALLAAKKPAVSYDQHPERPRILNFTPGKGAIRTGEEVSLTLDVQQEPPCALHYDWTMTGGGVQMNLLDRFVYYGGETGNHRVTVTVINEKGLLGTASLDISVAR